jgi:hypothetical protein
MNLAQVRMYLASETVTLEQADLYIDLITQFEQERILALLNSKRDSGSHDAENDFINAFIDDLAVLIKGEK